MRQRIRSHLTYANVMVTILAFIVLGGGTALAAFVVSSNSQIGPNTIYGHKAPTGANKNIIAGSVNGQDVAANSLTGANILESSLTGDVRTLIYNAAASTSPATTIATVGPYTIKGQCSAGGNNIPTIRITVNGPAGLADIMYALTENDTNDFGNHSNGIYIPASPPSTDTALLQFAADAGDFFRQAGTAMLRSGSVLVQVDFNAVADGRSSKDDCFLYGTATRAT